MQFGTASFTQAFDNGVRKGHKYMLVFVSQSGFEEWFVEYKDLKEEIDFEIKNPGNFVQLKGVYSLELPIDQSKIY